MDKKNNFKCWLPMECSDYGQIDFLTYKTYRFRITFDEFTIKRLFKLPCEKCTLKNKMSWKNHKYGNKTH